MSIFSYFLSFLSQESRTDLEGYMVCLLFFSFSFLSFFLFFLGTHLLHVFYRHIESLSAHESYYTIWHATHKILVQGA